MVSRLTTTGGQPTEAWQMDNQWKRVTSLVLGNAVAMNVEGVARVPEGRGRAGVTEDRGDVKEKGELAATIGVKGRRAADSPQVRGESNQGETNQGRAGRTWEPGGATSPRVSGGTECGRSQDGAVRPRWSEEIRGSTS